VGFRDNDVTYIPVSGLTGENLTKNNNVMNWYQGPTLVSAIDKLKPPQRLIEKSFRMAASDVFRPAIGSGLAVAGRIESGFVMANDKVLVQPLNEVATVKTIENAEGALIPEGIAFAGEHVSLILASIDAAASVSAGSVIVDPTAPLPVTRHFRAKVRFIFILLATAFFQAKQNDFSNLNLLKNFFN
jgi:elongation factor 1 alpha-like protein